MITQKQNVSQQLIGHGHDIYGIAWSTCDRMHKVSCYKSKWYVLLVHKESTLPLGPRAGHQGN